MRLLWLVPALAFFALFWWFGLGLWVPANQAGVGLSLVGFCTCLAFAGNKG